MLLNSAERLLRTTSWIGEGLQGHLRVGLADLPGGILQAPIEFVRSGRPTEIESSCAHVNSSRELMILSRNAAGEERARHCGGAKDGPGPHERRFGVHVNLFMNPC